MKLNSINYNTNTYQKRSFGNQTAPIDNQQYVSQTPEENTDKKKRIMTGAAIAAGVLLLGVIFRKNIKKLFNKEELIKTEPPKPVEPPEVTPPAGGNEPPVMPPVEPPKFNGEKTMAEYRELVSKQKPVDSFSTLTEEEKTLWHTQDAKIRELRLALKENNISFVRKEVFSPDPTKDIEAKRAYFQSGKVANARVNEASRLDYLEMFDKYGGRYWRDKECLYSSLGDARSVLGEDSSDKALGKYIDIMDKWAQRDNTGMRDAVSIVGTFKSHAHNMNKETALKFIKVLKKTSFQQMDALSVKHAINNPIKKVKYKDEPEIKAAVEDLKKSLEIYPYQDRTHND